MIFRHSFIQQFCSVAEAETYGFLSASVHDAEGKVATDLNFLALWFGSINFSAPGIEGIINQLTYPALRKTV